LNGVESAPTIPASYSGAENSLLLSEMPMKRVKKNAKRESNEKLGAPNFPMFRFTFASIAIAEKSAVKLYKVSYSQFIAMVAM